MSQVLRRCIIIAILFALLSMSVASPVLSNVPGFVGEAHAEHCGGSSC